MTAHCFSFPNYSHNHETIGHSDQGGWPDRVQLMVSKSYSITRHTLLNVFSVIDIRDPHNPKPAY